MTLLSSNTPPLGNCAVNQQILRSENIIHNNDSAEDGRIPPVPLEVLHSFSGPAPSKEVYSNLHVLAAPTGVGPIVLRSELQKSRHEGVSWKAAIVHSLKKVAIKCNKRKRDVSEGGPIPDEDLIDLTSDQEKEDDSDLEVEANQLPATRKVKMSQATGGGKQTHRIVKKNYKSKAIVNSGDEADSISEEREEGEILEAVNVVVSDHAEADLPNPTHITDVQISGGGNIENIGLVPAAFTPQDISAKATSTNNLAPPAPTASTSPLITFVNPNTSLTTQNALNSTPVIIHNGLPQSSVDSAPKPLTVLLNDEVRDKVHESLTWFGQGNLRSEKLSRVQSSVKTFVELRNQPQDDTQNSTTPSFQLICSDGSARGWTKDINKFTASLLKPSANEAWSANVSEAKDDEPSTAVVEQRKSLDKLRQRHNYLPFCMFMVAGVRGIILAPKDHRHLKGSDSLGILESLNIIYKSSTNHQRVEEVYWKELGNMFNFQRPLTLELAKAVATDFLNSWHQTVPNKVFEFLRALINGFYSRNASKVFRNTM
ncbi:hypothetical protein BY996DRAFT_6408369 [Phakopsora pachyrhizi]|nr:hypothetical protein BY996DRAFT_6408369 [Phakopsora pachyrhizi]